MAEKVIQVVLTEYSQDNIEPLLRKYANGGKLFRSQPAAEFAVCEILCPLWIMTVLAKFKRMIIKDYRLVTGVAVDGWTRQAGSIGVMPGCEEMVVPTEKILETNCTQEHAEEQALLFLADALTIRYRSIPNMEVRNTNLVYQPMWMCRYTDRNDKIRFIFVDGITGRQIYRYDNKLSELAYKLEGIKNLYL